MFDVITIGTATRDVFVASDDFHINRDRRVLGGRALVMPLGAKLEIEKMVFTTGGGATNTAVTLRRHGLRTAVVSVVGDDTSGRTIKKELSREGIGTDFLVAREKSYTAYTILLHLEGGERTILVHRGASESLGPSDIPRGIGKKTAWLYITSLAGNIGLLKHLLVLAKKNGVRVCYNPGGKEIHERKKLIPFLMYIDILTLDREEASLLTGISYEKPERMFAVWDRMSPGINIMTDARNGVWVSDGASIYRAGVFKERAVIDRTGAGDAFGSGFAAVLISRIGRKKGDVSRLIRPRDIEYAIRFGSANATSKIEGIGAKFGLLTKRAFKKSPRWRHFPISKKPITNG